LFVFARHAESTANAAGVVSANPARHVPLTERGRSQARQLGAQVDCLRIDVAVATRFARTQETAKLALDRRQVPLIIEPALDEIHARAYDGLPLGTYRPGKTPTHRASACPMERASTTPFCASQRDYGGCSPELSQSHSSFSTRSRYTTS
jgi:broad specificity phosphatase PhoE